MLFIALAFRREQEQVERPAEATVTGAEEISTPRIAGLAHKKGNKLL